MRQYIYKLLHLCCKCFITQNISQLVHLVFNRRNVTCPKAGEKSDDSGFTEKQNCSVLQEMLKSNFNHL